MNDHPYSTPQADVPPPILPERPSVWPMVLGIIGILLGLYYLCGGLMGLFASSMSNSLLQMNPATQNLPEDYLATMATLQKVNAFVSLPSAMLLLAASILLIMRRAVARALWQAWSVIFIIATVGLTIYSWPMQKKMMDAVTSADPNMANSEAMAGIMGASAGIGLACGLIFALALPIFTLIWFNLSKVRREVEWWRQRWATQGGSL